MNCSCIINMGTDGYARGVCDEWRNARKTHKCGECYRMIQIGEKYKCEKNVYEGELETFKTCTDCMSVRDALFCNWMYGEIWEAVGEEVNNGDIPESCLAEMTKNARDKICEMIQERWKDLEEEDEM